MDTPNYLPLYSQVKELMIKRMTDKHWVPGMLLPSETELARELNVSQGTVRKALDELASDKLVIRKQGRGTFVSEHDSQRALFHFFNLIGREDGGRNLPKSHVLSIEDGLCNAQEKLHLDLESKDMVIRISRVRFLEERPVIYEVIAVPQHLFPYLTESEASLPNTLYSLYESRYNVSVAKASEWLSANPATTDTAHHLLLNTGDPVLTIQRVAYTLSNRAIELRISHCDTTHHQYLSELN